MSELLILVCVWPMTWNSCLCCCCCCGVSLARLDTLVRPFRKSMLAGVSMPVATDEMPDV